jgi:hypothetical protein
MKTIPLAFCIASVLGVIGCTGPAGPESEGDLTADEAADLAEDADAIDEPTAAEAEFMPACVADSDPHAYIDCPNLP